MATDTKLVEAVLGEDWGALDGDVYSQHSETTILVGANPSGGRDNERARQAAIGHAALRYLVALVDSGQLLDGEGAGIVERLRGGGE
jgi:hypothetical protein